MKNKYNILVLSTYIIITVNIYSQYVPEWVNLYPTGISGYYNYKNIAIDQLDNYYIAGYYFLGSQLDAFLYKFNSSGQFQWVKIYYGSTADSFATPTRILISSDNNVFVIGTNRDYSSFYGSIFILKYDGNGNLINSLVYKRAGNDLTAGSDAVIDNSSNVYISGSVYKYPTTDSLYTAKFNSNLSLVWERTYANTDTIYFGSWLKTIKIDDAGNVYTAGQLNVANWNNDIVTLKYSSTGSLSWVQKYAYNAAVLDESANDIDIDASGNVVVTGYTSFATGNDTGFTVVLKYNNSGQPVWSNTFNTNTYGTEQGVKILRNTDYYIQVNSYTGTKLLKINTGGVMQWNTSIPGSVSYYNFDNLNNLTFTGCQTTQYNNPLSIVKVNLSGVIFQNYLYSYNGAGTDNGLFFKSYNDSKLYILSLRNNNLLFLKLTPANTYNITYTRNNINKLISDSNYTYDTINFNQSDLPLNAYIKDVNISIDTILHPSDGDLEISLIHNGFTDTLVYRRGGPFANFISTKLDDTSNFNVCSAGQAPFTGYFKPCFPLAKLNLLTAEGPWILRIYDRKAPNTGVLKSWGLNITYDAAAIGIKPISLEIPSHFSLSQNYPNPFNPVTKIKFAIPAPLPFGEGPVRKDSFGGVGSIVRLIIYDILGREVETLVNEQLKPGTYEVTWDPEISGHGAPSISSGVYFYRISAGDFTNTKKMILIK